MDIATGYSALTAAFEIAKGLKNIDDQVKLNGAVIELQEKILSAQQAATDAKSRMAELEQTVQEFNDWSDTSKRYVLRDFGCETYAYQARTEALNGEPMHLACPNCYRDRRLAILQYENTYYGRRRFKCLACDKSVDLGCIVNESRSYRVETDWNPYDP